MKRYASHLLLLPEYGYLRKQVVELDKGCAIRIFPLTEEIESVEWLPGVIVLLSEANQNKETSSYDAIFGSMSDMPKPYIGPTEVLEIVHDGKFQAQFYVYLFFPFDFTALKPVDETRRRQLL